MTAQFRSELFKQRTTRTNLGLLLAMVALIAVVVLLHVVALPTQELTGLQAQLKVVGLGTTFGMIFGSLIGALSITTEMRNGMIRPTFLAMPYRSRVIAAKVMACLIAGAALGLLSEAIAVGVGAAGLAARGIQIAPSVGDFAQLLVGGAAAAALWAAIGVGIGATIRSQVGAAISLVVWLLFIEMTVIGVAPAVGKFLPGASGGALAGAMLQQTATYLLVPALGALLIVAYAVVAVGAGLIATARRDIT
jgi:ABC-2 type transport system permease protein